MRLIVGTMFKLHHQLETDSDDMGHFPLCQLLLSKDANYPWFILVPQVEGISEIHELSEQDQAQLLKESSLLAAHLKIRFQADKLNIAALGNVVLQLHIHHIVRYIDDPSWPAPIWGAVPATAYTEHHLAAVLAKLDRAGMSGFEFE